jgi:hypothetical protein
MTEAASLLVPWSNFYMMTGSSAAALTGLMFVVITLVTGEERVRKAPDGISAFSTPTVVHFSAALVVSAILSAPWHLLLHPAILLGLIGLYGVIYQVRVIAKARGLTNYDPDMEDWIWFTILPFSAYIAILAGAVFLMTLPVDALFAFAASVMLMIVLGIRNAWDVVTFIAVGGADQPPDNKPDNKT